MIYITQDWNKNIEVDNKDLEFQYSESGGDQPLIPGASFPVAYCILNQKSKARENM